MNKLFLFLFNQVPNYLIFRFLKEFLLKIAGVNIKMRSSYILSPFYIDNLNNLTLSNKIFINKGLLIEGDGLVSIDSNCQIGPNVIITTTNHNISNNMESSVLNVKIKKNVWIGAGVIINPGITIGPNVIVASGAVVTKNFNNCTIAGIPAGEIKRND